MSSFWTQKAILFLWLISLRSNGVPERRGARITCVRKHLSSVSATSHKDWIVFGGPVAGKAHVFNTFLHPLCTNFGNGNQARRSLSFVGPLWGLILPANFRLFSWAYYLFVVSTVAADKLYGMVVPGLPNSAMVSTCSLCQILPKRVCSIGYCTCSSSP